MGHGDRQWLEGMDADVWGGGDGGGGTETAVDGSWEARNGQGMKLCSIGVT